jgi:hypothetical protein
MLPHSKRNQGRKETLQEPEKQIIIEMYKKRVGSKVILEVLKVLNPKVKRHHIHQFAWKNQLTKSYKDRERESKPGFFNVIEYARTVATI